MSYWWLIAFCFGSYLVGNINFSVIISKVVLKNDIRTKGSGNPGASNMLRNFGFKWGLIILILDMLKGALPAVIGWAAYGSGYNFNPLEPVTTGSGQIAMYACGFWAVIGHCFPFWTCQIIDGKRIWAPFHGGKGVSTIVGIFVVTNPAIGFGGLFLGLFLGYFLEYPSVSSIVFVTLAVLWECFVRSPGVTVSIMLIIFYFFAWYTHRANIYRLLCGNEKRAKLFSRSKKSKA